MLAKAGGWAEKDGTVDGLVMGQGQTVTHRCNKTPK